MRKLKLQVQMSVDGFIAAANGELDWLEWNWDEDLKKYITELTEPVDCIVLGRKLAEGFIPHWSNIATKKDDLEFEAGKKFTETAKVVFTKTLDESAPGKLGWKHTRLAKKDLVSEINQLKTAAGKDIIAYGGASFVSTLVKHGLIDEYHLLINPTAIGKGLSIFQQLEMHQNLALVKSISFSCGIVLLHYRPK
jgi:dihydrofolate reductase